MPFGAVADWLAPAKVSFACSANFLDHLDAINLTAAQQAFLAEIPDATLRESARDFMSNQQFRKDYWIKGPVRLSSFEQREALRAEQVMLAVPAESVSLKLQGGLGEAALNAEVYQPILAALADHAVRSIAEVESAVKDAGVALSQVVEAIGVLQAQEAVVVAQSAQTVQAVRPVTDALNARLMSLARHSGDNAHLASPVSGGGVRISRFWQLFLAARATGLKKPDQWVDHAWSILDQQGQRIVKAGTRLETDAENRAELASDAKALQKRLPALTSLGLA
jgi:hypothetical protein